MQASFFAESETSEVILSDDVALLLPILYTFYILTKLYLTWIL